MFSECHDLRKFSSNDWSCNYPGLLVLIQNGIDSCNLVFGRLLLVCPRTDSDIALDSYHAIFMQQWMCLANHSHNIVPWTLCVFVNQPCDNVDIIMSKSTYRLLFQQSACDTRDRSSWVGVGLERPLWKRKRWVCPAVSSRNLQSVRLSCSINHHFPELTCNTRWRSSKI